MRSSATSSARATSPTRAGPPREQVALTGRSQPVDPLTHAVRADLADIRLANRVFAPHYAAPLERVLVADATLRPARDAAAEPIAQLTAGEPFELLDVTGAVAWGRAPRHDRAGYLPVSALGPTR